MRQFEQENYEMNWWVFETEIVISKQKNEHLTGWFCDDCACSKNRKDENSWNNGFLTKMERRKIDFVTCYYCNLVGKYPNFWKSFKMWFFWFFSVDYYLREIWKITVEKIDISLRYFFWEKAIKIWRV